MTQMCLNTSGLFQICRLCPNSLRNLVLDQLFRHLDHNNLWHTFQSAYRLKHSTETALLRVLNDLLTASESCSVSIPTLLYLSPAFDTMDRSILLTRLGSSFGIRDLALPFFRSYLQDRTQKVTVNEIKSSRSLLTCEGPRAPPSGGQFSSFNILLSCSDVISHHSVSHHMFANDTELYKSDSSSLALAVSGTIEACISNTKVWVVQTSVE